MYSLGRRCGVCRGNGGRSDLYCLPLSLEHPVKRIDEKPYQFLNEVREPIPISPGKPRKIDVEYVRKGTCSIFVYSEPLTGLAYANARERITKIDWTVEIRWLLEETYPKAIKVRLVSDNLNTHVLSSLYKAFPPINQEHWHFAWRCIIRPSMAVSSTLPKSK